MTVLTKTAAGTAHFDSLRDSQSGQSDVAGTLDLASKLFQESVYPSALKVAQGGKLAAPLVVDLDPTTFCDLACPECVSSPLLNKNQFSSSRLVRLAEELAEAGVKGVILIGGGEPLIHKSTGEVIDILHRANIRIGLVTNGTLIDRHLDRLASKMSWVRVSVDAARQSTYDLFRPSGRRVSVYSRVIDNMRLLAERKTGKLGYSLLLMQRHDEAGRLVASNYEEVYEAGVLAKNIGCDYFEVKAMFDGDHFVVEPPAGAVENVERQLAQLREIEDDRFKILGASTWRSVADAEASIQPKPYSKCAVAQMRTTITPSGVYICPSHRGDPAARLGDVTSTSFKEMWKNADVDSVDPSASCQFHCPRHASNLALQKIAELGAAVNVVPDYDVFF